jgi:NhaA family Na+:H+ antiporter
MASPSPASAPASRLGAAWRVVLDNSLLMISGAVIALVWANLDAEGYERVMHPLHFGINDIGMVFFFGLATKEIIEATGPGGALHSARRAAVPVIAAIGGMAGPALIYSGLAVAVGMPELLRGWAIPAATDIAFSYLVARVIFGTTHPAVPFLLLLAIADDALGLVILAVFYPSGVVRPLLFAALLLVACGTAWAMRRQGTRNFWPYVLVPGGISWVAFYLGGLHPALALVPVLPFLPHAPAHHADPGQAHAPASRPAPDALNDFEHWWKVPVEFVLFFFALSNAGVPVSGAGTATWIVLAALVIGKPLGITLCTLGAEAVGLSRPAGLAIKEVVVLGLAAGIGFTVALFFTTAAFPLGDTLNAAKLGALLSIGAAGLAILLARLLRVGRVAAR